MRVLYHVTMPPSPMAACDAVLQEVQAIRALAPGDVMHLYPARAPGTRFPRRLWGMQNILQLLRADLRVDVHHVFNPDPYPFAVLRLLRKPIVYTAVAGAHKQHRLQAVRLSQMARVIVVPDAADQSRMLSWGITNSAVVRSSIAVHQFSHTPVGGRTPPTLLMGSAPWSEAQFHTKGVDALLQVARQHPDLRLVFLWRGVLEDAMRRRITDAELDERVTLLAQQVDVNEVLAAVHACAALASDADLIKAYPHSLLESLAAGKPVLVSRLIPMARDIEAQGCGVVVDEVSAAAISDALHELLEHYERYSAAARQAALHVPDEAQMAQSYLQLYQSILGGAG